MSFARIKKEINQVQCITQQSVTAVDWQKRVEQDYGQDVDLNKALSLYTSWEEYYKNKLLAEFNRAINALPFFHHKNLPLPESLQTNIDGLLNIAAQHGHEVWFKEAERNGIDFSKTNRWDVCRLTSAINYGYVRVFTFLIEKKGDEAKDLLFIENNFNKNALQMSAQTQIDNPIFLKMIIKLCGKEIINRSMNDEELTLLHYAAIQGNACCLDYLIKKGANLEQKARWNNIEVTAEEVVKINQGKMGSPNQKFENCLRVFEAEKVRKLDHSYLGLNNLFQEAITYHKGPQQTSAIAHRFRFLI